MYYTHLCYRSRFAGLQRDFLIDICRIRPQLHLAWNGLALRTALLVCFSYMLQSLNQHSLFSMSQESSVASRCTQCAVQNALLVIYLVLVPRATVYPTHCCLVRYFFHTQYKVLCVGPTQGSPPPIESGLAYAAPCDGQPLHLEEGVSHQIVEPIQFVISASGIQNLVQVSKRCGTSPILPVLANPDSKFGYPKKTATLLFLDGPAQQLGFSFYYEDKVPQSSAQYTTDIVTTLSLLKEDLQ